MNESLNQDQPDPKETRSWIWEFVRTGLVVLLIVIPIRAFVAQPFIVSGASMEPTFSSGDYLIIDQLSYEFHDPDRQDVIVFRYPNDPSKFYIKRVIGVPGDTVSITNGNITIFNDANPDGFSIDEPYIDNLNAANDELETTLESGEYFVLGDNRQSSSDSRIWGVLPERFLVGEAFLQLLPPSEITLSPGAPPAESGNPSP